MQLQLPFPLARSPARARGSSAFGPAAGFSYTEVPKTCTEQSESRLNAAVSTVLLACVSSNLLHFLEVSGPVSAAIVMLQGAGGSRDNTVSHEWTRDLRFIRAA